ncbi:hypothetical protein Pmar_PMAR019370 [Perkinsus marinus ATCC 50983]|uniref:EF-hand domain-containing protein n=2 Tax=Perkinsus marinus (strain ATCC 50983 / TXsc) TaxID=423536 RepID=C5L8D8_PERM5|nr:hypothetical protein Pmar_PMAR019370 [Perkinsus marinus ATCC 50983]EER07005.1 hypothetical protein Pmar_PMAR019370 [Perkinsus marinus ATCC 50983]|eukprot:XP_002775189.1 hypothetical protein Pmar_PMAR019370 [Perkinsus marinus ATCC 50983]
MKGVSGVMPSPAGSREALNRARARRLSGDRTAAWYANAPSPYATLARIRAVETSRHFVKMRYRSGDHSVSEKYVLPEIAAKSVQQEAGQEMQRSRFRCDALLKDLDRCRKELKRTKDQFHDALVASQDFNWNANKKLAHRDDKGGHAATQKGKSTAFGPEEIDKVRIFADLAAEVSPREKALREAAKMYKIPLFDAENIWKKFKKICAEGSSTMTKKEFEILLLQLLRVAAIRPSRLDEWWRSLDRHKKGEGQVVCEHGSPFTATTRGPQREARRPSTRIRIITQLQKQGPDQPRWRPFALVGWTNGGVVWIAIKRVKLVLLSSSDIIGLAFVGSNMAKLFASMVAPSQPPPEVLSVKPVVPPHVLESLLSYKSKALISRVPLSKEALRRISFEAEALSAKLASEALASSRKRREATIADHDSEMVSEVDAAEEDDLMRALAGGEKEALSGEQRVTLEDVIVAAKALGLALPLRDRAGS